MEISKERIEAIKKAHDLTDVVASYGIKVHKKGTNYAALCPFDEEKTPSFIINPKTRLYHCFGCNAAGDVIGFVSKMEGIGFRQGRLVERSSLPSLSQPSGGPGNDIGNTGRGDADKTGDP